MAHDGISGTSVQLFVADTLHTVASTPSETTFIPKTRKDVLDEGTTVIRGARVWLPEAGSASDVNGGLAARLTVQADPLDTGNVSLKGGPTHHTVREVSLKEGSTHSPG